MARISKSELLKLQRKVKRDAAIGEAFGITRQAVHQLRKKYGIGSVIEGNPKRNKEIIKLYKSGKSVAWIAKKYDLSISYTYRIISESKGTKAAVKKTTKKAAKKAVRKSVKKAARKAAKKPVRKTAKKSAKKAARKTKKAAKKK